MKTSWVRCVATSVLTLTIAVGTGFVGAGAASDRAVAAVGKLLGVSCPSVTTCFAVGGPHVLTTSDAGATWTEVTSPPSVGRLYGISCWSARRCEVVGTGFGAAGAIYATVDGGLTWRHQPAEIAGGVFFAISCASRSFCAATGSSGTLSVTHDGGRTWDGQRVEDADFVIAVDCVSTTVCEAVGSTSSVRPLGTALRTTDSGQHWDVTQLPDALPYPGDVACTSNDTCVLVGMGTLQPAGRQRGRIAVTKDAGATWRIQRIPSGYSYVSGIDCPTARICVAAGYGPRGMLGSVNGGRTWTAQGPRDVAMRAVRCPGASTCTVVGESSRSGRGAIYGTTSGGPPWVRQFIG